MCVCVRIHIYIYTYFPDPVLHKDAKEGVEVAVGRSTLPAFVLAVSGPAFWRVSGYIEFEEYPALSL